MSQLAPPGSSTYNSDTMHVGDGTWDAGRDNFLLPPLVGVNFATMRYNGMGNRFFTLTGYHPVVKAHGIIAAITFLFCVPAAILIMRFGGRRPGLARQFHIWLQILTLLLSTVVLILGVFAVGPSRSLTNPHHGIGVAIYTLIWVQVIGGCLVYRSERKRRRMHLTLRAMMHHWLGRAIALLGIAQVALGLTVYGSPLFLFVLYALVVFALLVIYFVLQWLHERRRGEYQSQHGSYTQETTTRPSEHGHGGWGKVAAAGAAGAGLAALFGRRKSSARRPAQSEVASTEDGTSYVYSEDEKHSNTSNKGWGRRLLQIGAIGGGLAAAKKIFGRKRAHVDDDYSDVDSYRPPLGGNQSVTTTDSMSRIEEGRPPRPITPVGASPGHIRPTHPLAQPPMTPGLGRRHSDDTYSYDSYESASPSRQGRHQTFRQAIAAGGTMFAVKQLFKNRREKKEDQRAEALKRQRLEEERVQRMDSTHRYTGDGIPPPPRMRHDRINSQTASDVSSAIDGVVQPHRVPGTTSTLPIGAGSPAGILGAGAGAAAANALADRDHVRPVGADPIINNPGPSSTRPGNIPPPPPPHIDPVSSGSELYTTASGRQRHRHHLGGDAAAAGAAGLVAGALASDSTRRRTSGRTGEAAETRPVSLNVKVHQDGRHVTLRRLTEEEAAAQREARRRERRANRRRNSANSSDGESFGPGSSADRRWRRTEAMEAQQEAENRANAAAQSISPMPAASTSGPIHYPTPPPPGAHPNYHLSSAEALNLPRPPPIPASTSNLGPIPTATNSITSPGTETSGATEYANNRRRRRAERAQARLAREGRAGGNTVDFIQ